MIFSNDRQEVEDNNPSLKICPVNKTIELCCNEIPPSDIDKRGPNWLY